MNAAWSPQTVSYHDFERRESGFFCVDIDTKHGAASSCGIKGKLLTQRIRKNQPKIQKFGMALVTTQENLTAFTDSGSVSAYAVQAMNWAVGQKLIGGTTENRLDPQGNATRAQAAMILHGFVEVVR